MKTVTHARSTALRYQLRVLAAACPFGEDNPGDCPLFMLRQMKPRERWQWFSRLDEADLSYLAAYHHICLTTKVRMMASGDGN